jgi:hypothetical protein
MAPTAMTLNRSEAPMHFSIKAIFLIVYGTGPPLTVRERSTP